MDNLAKLILQGVGLIICFVGFATVKGKFLNALMLFNTIACAIVFYTNYFSNFCG